MKLSEIWIQRLTHLFKLLGILAAFDKIPFIPAHYGLIVVAVASWGKDALYDLLDMLDDGKKNRSVSIGVILIGAVLFCSAGCSTGAGRFMRELAKDPNTAAVESDFDSLWFKHRVRVVRSGGTSTNTATAGDGRAAINSNK
jgi:hypothetical protein